MAEVLRSDLGGGAGAISGQFAAPELDTFLPGLCRMFDWPW